MPDRELIPPLNDTITKPGYITPFMDRPGRSRFNGCREFVRNCSPFTPILLSGSKASLVERIRSLGFVVERTEYVDAGERARRFSSEFISRGEARAYRCIV